jgi:hypothetical protein
MLKLLKIIAIIILSPFLFAIGFVLGFIEIFIKRSPPKAPQRDNVVQLYVPQKRQ